MPRTDARKLAALLGAAILLLALAAGPALGAPGPGERPGWGNGDTINVHEDPPGLNTEGENERPGYGHGDTNHANDGPPGLNLD